MEFTPAPLPASVRRRGLGECIGNAINTAIWEWPTLDYAEGLAKSRFGLWYRHAWNVADGDVVVDSTWTDGQRYVGRIYPLEDVVRRVQGSSRYDYMDMAAMPFVPEGEAGVECWTEAQWRWIQAQYRTG